MKHFIAQEYGSLDLLVTNAGVMEQVDLLAGKVEDAAIAREIETNLTAPILLTRRLPMLSHVHETLAGSGILAVNRFLTISH